MASLIARISSPEPHWLRRALRYWGPWGASATMLTSVTLGHAYPGELGTTVGAGVAAGSELEPGLALTASGQFGISEALDLNFDVGLSLHPDGAITDSGATLLRAAPSISYKLDVVKWVPYLGAGAGFFSAFGEFDDRGVAFELFTGMNYLVSRYWSVGAQYRMDLFLSDRYDTPFHSGVFLLGYSPGW